MPTEIEELYVVVGSDISGLLKDTKKGVAGVEKELKGMGDAAEKETSKASRGFKKLKDNAVKIGASIAAAFTAAVVAVKKLTDATVELDKATTNLAISANAAAREFGQAVGNSESWQNTIKELGKELRIYSDKELANASTRLIDMTKRLGLTEDQMVELLRRTSDLSAGKVDLEGGIERVTAAMRGEAESAEYLGLSLNENTVKAYAEAQGVVWKSLSDTEKAQQRYNLFLEQTNELQGRAAVFADTLAGREAILTAQLENQSAVLGEQLLPLREGYVELIDRLSTSSENGGSVIQNVLAGIAASFVALGATAIASFDTMASRITLLGNIYKKAYDAIWTDESIADAIADDVKKMEELSNQQVDIVTSFGDTWNDSFDQIRDGWKQLREDQKQTSEDLADFPVPDPEEVERLSKEALKALDMFSTGLLDLQDDINGQSEKLEQDHADKVIEINDDYTDALNEAEDDRTKAIAKADKKRAKAIADLEKDLAKQRRDIIASTRKELAELEEDTKESLNKERDSFNRDELRETEDHLNSMRELRNGYLMSLEDAVKNRDARALVDARRKFIEDQQQEEDAFSLAQSRRGEDQDLRLQEIREQEQQRAGEIMEAQAEELNRLKEAEAEKRAAIAESYAEESAAAQERYEEDAAKAEERKIETLAKEQEKYDESKEQLDEAMEKRLEDIAKALADEEEINEDEAKRILETLSEYFGIDGSIDKLMEDFANRRRAKIEIQIGVESGSLPSTQSGAVNYSTASQSAAGNQYLPTAIPSFATGGTLFANKPTLAQFGEVPEMVQFTPLSQMNNSNGTPQRMQVDINMSGSAPPGIRSTERDQIASVLISAFDEAGFSRPGGTR